MGRYCSTRHAAFTFLIPRRPGHRVWSYGTVKLIGLFLLFFSLYGCERPVQAWKLHGGTMGTQYHITLVPDANQRLSKEAMQTKVEAVLEQVNQQMSTYLEDSELSQLNKKPESSCLPVSEPLYQVIELSQEVGRLSQGAFDVTVGPLVNLWGFGPGDMTSEIPPKNEIAAIKQQIGYHYLELTPQPHKVCKLRDVKVDLSGVAKGYAVDQLSNLFDQQGFEHYLVDIGGELRLKGKNPKGSLWRIGVETPSLIQGSTQKAISLTGVGIATSGDYRNYFEKDGQRYSHTIDPVTGYPVKHKLASVTVIDKSAARADALATAMNVMGPEKAMALAESQDIAVFMIIRTENGFSEQHSTAFAPYLN